MSLTENSLQEEIMIFAYINAKQLLSTKQISKNDFFNKLEEQFQENGIQISKNQIINTWYKLVRKYESIKIEPSKGDINKNTLWSLYTIMDSCYDYSDFQFSPLTKFSDEMLWFLVDSVFRKRRYFNSQPQVALDEIYQEFLDEGYIDLRKGDVDARWKYLKRKYNKFKNCTKVLERTPYLIIVGQFVSNALMNKKLVKMTFTKKITKFLIEQYTKRKKSFLVHGHQYVPLLLEIQKEFRKLGYNYSLTEIKAKWLSLTTVYKFLKVRVENSPWIYFNAMKDYYDDIKESTNTKKRLRRKRSHSTSISSLPQFEKRLKPNKNTTEMYISENEGSNLSKNKAYSQTNNVEDISHLSIDPPRTIQEPVMNVNIVNIEKSDIDRKNDNTAINLPSISKKFSDNEFLPLKKRLRLEQEKYKSYTDIQDGFRGFSNTEKMNKSCDCARLTDAEMQDILDRAKKKQSFLTNNNYSFIYSLPENYLQTFINSKEQELMMKKIATSAGKPQMLVLVVKMDSSDSRKNGECCAKPAIPTIMEQLSSISVTTSGINEENSVSCSSSSCNIAANNSISILANNQNEKYESVEFSTEFIKSALESESLQVNEDFPFEPNTSGILGTDMYKSTQSNEESQTSSSVKSKHNAANSPNSDMKTAVDIFHNKKSVRLPVVSINGNSFTKDIFISPNELDKISHMKLKTSSRIRNEATQLPNLEDRIMNSINGSIKLVSDIISKERNNMNGIKNNKIIETNSSNRDIISESENYATFKNDLLLKVIDFHEQSMREFSDIKNLIVANNLLQKETNRLLQQMLEKS